MEWLQVSGISKKEVGFSILSGISFTQRRLQKMAIAGATGSGKTTLLKIIAGLLQPDSGTVFFEGNRVEGPDEKLLPGYPGVAYLSQHFELRNRYRVEELLQMSNQLEEQDATLVYAVCKIDHLLKRWTHQLSGGERQRIALACLLVTAPKLLLLDEPYSNLDALHKAELKTVLQGISEQLEITCLLVSHDPVDVLSWANTILVLQNGRVIQKGTPEFLYYNPVNEYAAALFGKYTVLPTDLVRQISPFKTTAKPISQYIRPEQFKLVAETGDGVKAEVVHTRFMGGYYEVEFLLGGTKITSHTQNPFEKGTPVFVSLS
jgi:ABC-type sulfate/molybdate transport systems ATPase subunit